MPDYDGHRFTPPAPVANVTIRTLDRARSVANVAMLIDSGADVTLIPQACADQLGLRSAIEEGFILQGFGGGAGVAKVVNAELVFLGRNFRGPLLIIDQESGVLGRNVLNHLSLSLDGPRLIWGEGVS